LKRDLKLRILNKSEWKCLEIKTENACHTKLGRPQEKYLKEKNLSQGKKMEYEDKHPHVLLWNLESMDSKYSARRNSYDRLSG